MSSTNNGHTPTLPGISDDIRDERGVVYVQSLTQLSMYEARFTKAQQQSPGLLFPQYRLGRTPVHAWSLRPESPRMGDSGKTNKYEHPAGVPTCLDVLPRYRDALSDPTVPIWLTEGAKKADALASAFGAAIVPINIGGVWCWRRTGKDGASRPLDDFDAIAWQGRSVVLAFDSDVRSNAGVQQGLKALATYLRRERKAKVRFLVLPQDGDEKVGVDDALADGMTPDALLNHIQDTLPSVAPSSKPDLLDAGRLFADRYGQAWAYDVDTGFWRRWTGTHWAEETRTATRLDAQAAEILRALEMPITSAGRVDGVVRLAATCCARSFVRRPGLVNFANGTLDTATLQLRPHAVDDQLDYCLSYAYAPGPHPRIDAFLADTMPDPQARAAYQAHLGLALLGDTKLHKALLLIGPTRSGKSKSIQLANSVCGNGADAGPGASLFDRETEGLRSRATWNDRRLVTIEELPVEALRNEEVIKAMTAHGGVAQRRLHQQEVLDNQWRPKLLMATNEAPRYADRSGALTERLIIISCPNHRPEDTRDADLLDKLTPELGAFAATCINAALDTLAAGRYPQSDAMRRELTEIEQSGDAVKSFVYEQCMIEPDAWTDSATLYSAYKDYCTENGHSAMSKNKFTQALCERFRTLEPKGKHIPRSAGTALTTVWTRGIDGIRLRTEDDLPPADDDPPRATVDATAATAAQQQTDASRCSDIPHCNAVNGQAATAATVDYRPFPISEKREDQQRADTEKKDSADSAVAAVAADPYTASESPKTVQQQTDASRCQPLQQPLQRPGQDQANESTQSQNSRLMEAARDAIADGDIECARRKLAFIRGDVERQAIKDLIDEAARALQPSGGAA